METTRKKKRPQPAEAAGAKNAANTVDISAATQPVPSEPMPSMPMSGMAAERPYMSGADAETSMLPPQRTDGALPVGNTHAMMPLGEERIGEEELIKANTILRKYKAGKANHDRRVIACEQWYKMRHWDYLDEAGNPRDNQPASAWLFNCLMSKHADGIEAYPEPNIRPREPGDKDEARRLSAIVPVVMQQNDFEETYSDQLWQKLIQGTGIYGAFWDKDKLNGLGDISIRKMDVLNMFWEPGITDIQASRHVFTVELVDLDLLREMYPDRLTDEAVAGKAFTPSKYYYDDNVDTSDKVTVIDWYYHKRQNGRNVLHYCKYVDTIVLYATENDPELRERGLYDHGMFPFVFDPLFPIQGSPCGHGYVDVGKNAQGTIDRMNQALEKNTLMGATPRFFANMSGNVNMEEFADWTNPIVHVTNTQLGEDSLRQIKVDPMSGIYAQILQSKIEELKETTGNRDVANGGTSTGVTAASAIAAMQEQAGKTSRASTRSAYRAYARLINMVIELIRQFYDMPRQFRITGQNGKEEYVSYSNAGIKPQHQGVEMGVDMGYRLPVFDIEVSAQKMTAYTKVSQNELAIQMFQLGVLEPANADKALALLDIMDFEHKDIIEDKVRQNGTMYQMLAQYQQIALTLASQLGQPELVEALAQNIQMTQAQVSGNGAAAIQSAMANSAVRWDNIQGLKQPEHAFVQKSRAQAQASTQPGG